jgi:outer membrane protein OmpA-like peptidoglycan-associated protein
VFVLLFACRNSANQQVVEPSPQPALDYIANAFDRYPIVALSEIHGNRDTARFLSLLLRHEGFSKRVDDIVVEFGNAAYQPLVDRYIAGAPVDRNELRQIWENTTQLSGIWRLRIYEDILADIRAVNATLRPDRRYRVLLGDPPIDWRQVTSPADEDMNDWRDAHFAWVLEHHVLARKRRALLFIGGAHISRRVVFSNSVIHLLDARFPGQTLVVQTLDAGQVEPAVAAAMHTWPVPSAVPVQGTWLGRSDVQAVGFRFSKGLVQDDVDALLTLSTAPLVSEPAPRIDDSTEPELQRRRRLAAATMPFRGGLIRFEENTTRLTPSSAAPLSEVAAELLRDRERVVLVKAFADPREREPLLLSTRRAASVADWLVARGVAAGRLEARGCSVRRLLWSDETPAHQEANRRVEIVTKTATADCEPPRSF